MIFFLSLPLFIGLDTLPSLREFIGGMENVTFGKVHMGKWLWDCVQHGGILR